MEKAELYGLAGYGLARGIYQETIGHRLNSDTCGNLGWACLAAGVVAWDIFAKETLSEAVDRSLLHNRAATLGAIAITSAHLANLIPEKIDPFHQATVLARKLTSRQ